MTQATEDTRKNLSATMPAEDEVTYEDIVRALRSLPKNKPLPDTPEIRELVIDMVLEMYGPAFARVGKELGSSLISPI